MDRRRFVGAFAGSLAIASPLARAQQSTRVYRIGFLLGATADSVASLYKALVEGLHELGYVEGRNVVFEQRYGNGQMERLPDLAAELVRSKVDVIVTGTNVHVAAVRKATSSIPIVFIFAADPVRSGFVKTLAHPGSNATGLSADASPELWPKYLTMLREIVPKLSRVGIMGQVATQVGFSELQDASRKLDVALEVADIPGPEDFDRAFAALIAKKVGALLVIIGPVTYLLKERIADAALKYRLPTISNANQYAQAGLLMSYGPDLTDLYRRAANYVDKILHGANPAELPVEQPSKYELAINLKTARVLGITMPQALLMRAEEVIQ
jgi:putative ABC transport system substrate-binding protein